MSQPRKSWLVPALGGAVFALMGVVIVLLLLLLHREAPTPFPQLVEPGPAGWQPYRGGAVNMPSEIPTTASPAPSGPAAQITPAAPAVSDPRRLGPPGTLMTPPTPTPLGGFGTVPRPGQPVGGSMGGRF